VTEWDIDRCIWELTPEQQRRRPYSQRLVYVKNQLVRVETITGSGALNKQSDSATFRYEGERVVEKLHTNRNGVPKGSTVFTEDGTRVRWLDEQARPLNNSKKGRASGLVRVLDARGRVVSYNYVDNQGQPTEQEGAYEVRTKRNAVGAITEEAYFGLSGEPVLGASGAHRIVHVVDVHGLDLELRHYGKQGEPTLANGAHLVRYVSDVFGNTLETRYFDVQGAPTRSSTFDASVVRLSRDSHGNEVTMALFDERERPVIGGTHFATRKRRFDAQDLPTEWAFFDVDGAPLRLEDQGNAIMRQTRDGRGNVVSERFYDEHATPISGREGYYRVDIAYDQRDNPTSYSYFGVDGGAVTVLTGYSVRRLSYDGDRLIRTTYHDASGNLVNIDRGYATIETSYEADGSQKERTYLDAGGTPIRSACRGSITPELATEISARAASVRECYEKLLGASAASQGRLMVELSIDQSGVVARAEAIGDEIGVPSFTQCVVNRMRRPYNHQPANGCAYARIPLHFVPKQSGENAAQPTP
jgi:YD repeat-containing protein